jgi:hypothetical protein
MNDFNLLRPVVFADLKVGEVLQAYSGLLPTVAYKAPAFAVLKFEDGSERCYEIYKLETSYKLVPLCWVENKPVYPGDGPLYYKDNPAWRHNEEGMFAWSVRDDELHFYNRMAFPIDTATWTKPEQKREPSFQVEGKDVFPGDTVYYYGDNKDNWSDPYTVKENARVVQQVTGCVGQVNSFNGGAASFRLKPMLGIGDQLVPMPVRDGSEMKLEHGYYVPSVLSENQYSTFIWFNDEFDRRALANNVVHKTPEAAVAHTEAFIALSKKKD